MIDPGQAESAKRPQRPGRILARLAEAGVLTVGQAAQEHVRFGIFEPVQGIHDLDLGPALLVALFRIDHQTIERGHEIADQFGSGLILDDLGRLRHDEAGSIREIAAQFQSGFRSGRLVAQGMKPGQLGIGPTRFLFPGHAVIHARLTGFLLLENAAIAAAFRYRYKAICAGPTDEYPRSIRILRTWPTVSGKTSRPSHG